MASIRNDRVPLSYLHQVLRLDHQSGDLYWLPRDRSMFANEWDAALFNRRMAGRRADLSRYPLNKYRRVRLRMGGQRWDISAHRVVFAMVHGRWPADEIDHIDGDRGNNAPANLREVSHAENMRLAIDRRRLNLKAA